MGEESTPSSWVRGFAYFVKVRGFDGIPRKFVGSIRFWDSLWIELFLLRDDIFILFSLSTFARHKIHSIH